ncbi:L-threonylcarbamoyladenylate synthase [Halosimplex sp. J119]
MTAPVLESTAENLERAAECIREGGVVVAPTDTNLGLTLAPWNPDAVGRAYDIKDRPAHKPLTLFVRDPDDWRLYADPEDPALVDRIVDEFWPGPLNLVLPSTDRVDEPRLRRDGTVSIGCLENPTWRALADLVDGPLAMTSANRSGTIDDDTLVDVALASEHVGDAVDYIVEGSARGTTRASAILSLAGEPELLRRGDVTTADLRSVLGADVL